MSNRAILLVIFSLLFISLIKNLIYFYGKFELGKLNGFLAPTNNKEKAKVVKFNIYKILWGIIAHYLVIISFLMLYDVYKYYGI